MITMKGIEEQIKDALRNKIDEALRDFDAEEFVRENISDSEVEEIINGYIYTSFDLEEMVAEIIPDLL